MKTCTMKRCGLGNSVIACVFIRDSYTMRLRNVYCRWIVKNVKERTKKRTCIGQVLRYACDVNEFFALPKAGAFGLCYDRVNCNFYLFLFSGDYMIYLSFFTHYVWVHWWMFSLLALLLKFLGSNIV